jgi:hypothetical protein
MFESVLSLQMHLVRAGESSCQLWGLRDKCLLVTVALSLDRGLVPPEDSLKQASEDSGWWQCTGIY